MSLATKHALRGYDAVQLAAALEAADERIASELPPLTLVSADDDLNAAAQAEDLNVENPMTTSKSHESTLVLSTSLASTISTFILPGLDLHTCHRHS